MADAVGEAGHGDPVDACVAVHCRRAADRFAVAFQDQVGEGVAIADHVGDSQFQVRVLGGELADLLADAGWEHAGEQEVWQYGDAARAECA